MAQQIIQLTFLEQSSSPANPDSGDARLYLLSGEKMYVLNSAGAAAEVSYNLSGVSTDRSTSLSDGSMYFDTTLGRPIWYTTTGGWVDADGTTA
ncbi:MAG: hypothetical protein WC365_00885 [Candidatus Babeliales bacterium]|jgi:hypothetical protein